jgi:hypothetical protein
VSVAGALTVLDSHLVTAGASVTPAIVNVAQGERSSLDRRIDYWIQQLTDPPSMSGFTETLTDRMFGAEVAIRAYIPVRDRRETLVANTEADLATVSANIAIRVLGDADLGGNVYRLTWNGCAFEWLRTDDGTWVRISTTTLTLGFVEQWALTL